MLLVLVLVSGASNMDIRCDADKIKSPIILQMPLPYENFEPKLHFIKQDKEVKMVRISPNTYELQGQFGYIHFLDITREINSVFFKSPSEHTVEGV